MAWNYRGYGYTRGSPDPYNIKTDGESMVKFLCEELCVQGKIGIYGRSLGGVVATHVARQFPEKIALLIADRTFGSLRSVSTRKFVGMGTRCLYDLASMQWETDNDKNFLEARCFKMVSCDPADDVVDEYASLAARTALQACKKRPFMTAEEKKKIFRLLCGLFTLEQFLSEYTEQQFPRRKYEEE